MASLLVHVDLDAARRYSERHQHERRMKDFAARQLTNRIYRGFSSENGFSEAIEARESLAMHHIAVSELAPDYAAEVAELVAPVAPELPLPRSVDPDTSPRTPRGPDTSRSLSPHVIGRTS